MGRAGAEFLVRAGIAVPGTGGARTAICRRCHDCRLGCAIRTSSIAINGGIMRKSSPTAAASMLGFAIVMSPFADLRATELKILAGSSMTGSLNQLGPPFELASCHNLTIHFDFTPTLLTQPTS